MNKKFLYTTVGIVVVAIVLLALIGLKPQINTPISQNQNEKNSTTTPEIQTKEQQPKPQQPSITVKQIPISTPTANSARVIFAITDAAVNTNDIKSIFVTVTEIKIHSQKSWQTIPFVSKKYDLLHLRNSGSYELLSDTNLAKGTYDQLSISIKEPSISKFDGANAAVKLPSGNIKLAIPTKIEKGDTVAITFDFNIDKSLIQTGNGTYIFMPFVKMASQTNIIAQIRQTGQVLFGGGANYITHEVGVDKNGDSIENFYIKPNIDVDLIGNVVKLKRSDMDESKLSISATRAIEITTANGNLDKILSIELKDMGNLRVWEITGTKKSVRATIYMDPSNAAIIQL